MSTDDPNMAYLCLECVKSEALKSQISALGEEAPCAVCGAANTRRIACDTPSFKSRLRSLIRFYFSESDYNTHLGGTHLETLLSRANPITNYNAGWNADAYEEALMDILDPAYEDFEKGISLYSGYTDNQQNMPLNALRRELHDGLRSVRLDSSRQNHFLLDDRLRRFVEPLADRIARLDAAGLALYRARIGYAAKAFPLFGWMEERHFRPHERSQLGAPPPPIAGAGRMNRGGVSFMYAATEEATALAEIRPHPGHYCTVGKFMAQRDLKVADVSTLEVTDFASSDMELDNFVLLRTIDEAFSVPVEERSEYHFPQLLADTFRHLGFDGVRYRSSVGTGKNYVFFDPSAFEYEERSAKVLRVDKLAYATTIMEPMGDDDLYLTRPDGSFL